MSTIIQSTVALQMSAPINVSNASPETPIVRLRGFNSRVLEVLNRMQVGFQQTDTIAEFVTKVGGDGWNKAQKILNETSGGDWLHYSRKLKALFLVGTGEDRVDPGVNNPQEDPKASNEYDPTQIFPTTKDQVVPADPPTEDQSHPLHRVNLVNDKRITFQGDEPTIPLSTNTPLNGGRTLQTYPDEQILAKTMTVTQIPDVLTRPQESDKARAGQRQNVNPFPTTAAANIGPVEHLVRQTATVSQADAQYDVATTDNEVFVRGRKDLKLDGSGAATHDGSGIPGQQELPGDPDRGVAADRFTTDSSKHDGFVRRPFVPDSVAQENVSPDQSTETSAPDSASARALKRARNRDGSDILIPNPTSHLRPDAVDDDALRDLPSRMDDKEHGLPISIGLRSDHWRSAVRSAVEQADFFRRTDTNFFFNQRSQLDKSIDCMDLNENNYGSNELREQTLPILKNTQDFYPTRMVPAIVQSSIRGW